MTSKPLPGDRWWTHVYLGHVDAERGDSGEWVAMAVGPALACGDEGRGNRASSIRPERICRRAINSGGVPRSTPVTTRGRPVHAVLGCVAPSPRVQRYIRAMEIRGRLVGGTVILNQEDLARVPRNPDGSTAVDIEIKIENLPDLGAVVEFVAWSAPAT